MMVWVDVEGERGERCGLLGNGFMGDEDIIAFGDLYSMLALSQSDQNTDREGLATSQHYP